MGFSDKLVSCRRRKGMSQQELSEACGISKRTVASYESDGRRPHPSTMKKLAAALGCTVDYLNDDTLDESSLPGEDEIYISALRQTYGDTTADEIAELLNKSAAYFAGGKLTQESKDRYFLALTNAYIACRNAGESSS